MAREFPSLLFKEGKIWYTINKIITAKENPL